MDWTAFLATTDDELKALRAAVPEPARGFAQLARAATAAGALDTKTKELIALAIGVSARCDGCIGYHVRAAIRHGASREEVAETLAMCVYMGGGPSLIYAGKALAAYDALAGAAAG